MDIARVITDPRNPLGHIDQAILALERPLPSQHRRRGRLRKDFEIEAEPVIEAHTLRTPF